jgi:hypothetical protein
MYEYNREANIGNGLGFEKQHLGKPPRKPKARVGLTIT